LVNDIPAGDGKTANIFLQCGLCYVFVHRKLDESEAVSLLDISVQNLTFLPARLFQVSLLYMGALTVNPLIAVW
jgi:hypothetical protein